MPVSIGRCPRWVWTRDSAKDAWFQHRLRVRCRPRRDVAGSYSGLFPSSQRSASGRVSPALMAGGTVLPNCLGGLFQH